MKKIIIFLLLLLWVAPVLAEPSFTFKSKQDIDLKIICLDETDSYCNNATVCNITSFYPNHSTLINNKKMTHNPTYFNYTFNSKAIGEYYTLIRCNGSKTNTTEFIFQITPTGQQRINEGEGTSLFIGVGVIVLLGLFFFIIGLKSRIDTFKIIFIGLAGLMIFISILLALVIISQNLGGFSSLVESYSTFFLVVKVLVSIFLLSLLIFGIIVAWRYWQFKRGLKGF